MQRSLKLTQPKPKPIWDRSRIHILCLLLKAKRPVPTGSIKTGQPVEHNSSKTRTVKEQFASEENREIASFNADNEFNRAINEENIDFNIAGVPHSAVK